jgi:hypothetical protein
MANEKQKDSERIRADLFLMTGGDFSPDSVGPEVYDATVGRARERANDYLDLLDALLEDPEVPEAVLAELRIPALLHLLREVAPERVRESAARWLAGPGRARAAMASRMESSAGPPQEDPDEAVRRQIRLEQRLRALERLAEEP